MPDITNDAELKAYVLMEIRRAMKMASDKIGKELWDNVFSRTSTLPETKFYERTGEFLDSVIKSPTVEINGNSVSVEIGMDSSKMQSKMGEPWQFNKHMDVYGNSDWKREGGTVAEALLSWWDEGTHRKLGTSFPELPTTNYWHDVMGDRGYKDNPEYKTMEKTFDEIMYRELSKIGTITKI